jgi:DNA (cytosine-5)-methyltransferase 1
VRAKPKALDLFCGAGGASRGLQLAGFHVTGIDIKPQPRYCGDLFIQANALRPPVRLADFDLIWASPPCQAFTPMRRVSLAVHRKLPDRPDLIAATRALLAQHLSTIIENVPEAPIRRDLVLCGSLFGLRVRRHRAFEMSGIWALRANCRHDYRALGVYGTSPDGRPVWRTPGTKEGTGFAAASLADGADAMGIDWMEWHELTQAVPPVYAEFIGRAALRYLGAAA